MNWFEVIGVSALFGLAFAFILWGAGILKVSLDIKKDDK